MVHTLMHPPPRFFLQLIIHLLLPPCSAQFPPQPDFLRSLDPVSSFRASVAAGASTVTLSNGLLTRVFATAPNWYTSEYRNEAGFGTSFLRGACFLTARRLWMSAACWGRSASYCTTQRRWFPR